MGDLLRELNSEKIQISKSPISPTALGNLILLIDKEIISGKIAKTVFIEMWKTGAPPDAIVQKSGLAQVSNAGDVEKMVDSVLAANASQVAEYRAGKTKVLGFLVGAIMKLSKGQANPDIVNEILKTKLDSKPE